MRISARLQTFTNRYSLVGPIFWILSIQYFIVQAAAALYWRTPYSLTQNPISDLGNTACGQYFDRYVCSPLHAWMNASFILLGLTITLGSVLIYQGFKNTTLTWAGFSCMVLAGIGTSIVGFFPENTIPPLHATGAILPFFFGNFALIILGISLDIPNKLKYATVGMGIIAVFALSLFTAHIYMGLGEGGMERLAAYPQTIWLIVFSFYIFRNHYRRKNKSK
jgi:hypothetical membrane protein